MSSKSVAARLEPEGKTMSCGLAARRSHGAAPLALVSQKRDMARPAPARKPGLY